MFPEQELKIELHANSTLKDYWTEVQGIFGLVLDVRPVEKSAEISEAKKAADNQRFRRGIYVYFARTPDVDPRKFSSG